MSKAKKITIAVLIGAVLLILSVKDALWFYRMMVNEGFARWYPDDKVGVVERLGEYGRLFARGEEAAENLDWANTVWNASDSASEDYQKAANIIVTDLEINKEQWLTLGNIIKYFGSPVNIDGLFPRTDEDGNVIVIPYDFNVYYEDKKIRFNFSLSGFLQSVMLVSLGGSRESGSGRTHWPHDYTYAKDFPIYAGFEYDKKINEFFLNRTKERIKDAIRKKKFFANIERLTPQEKELIDFKNVKIYLIDGITDELAIVFLEFSTKEMTRCYSAWFYKSDGQWHDCSSRDIELIAEKFGTTVCMENIIIPKCNEPNVSE